MSEATIYLTPRDVARALQLSRTTVYRRIADGSIRAVQIGGSLRIPGGELDRLANDTTFGPAVAELEHVAPTAIAVEVGGEWRAYETGEPVPPEALALFCRRPGPRKKPETVAFEEGERELEQRRIAARDFDRRLAIPVPIPFPREGTAYIAARPLELQDLNRNVRQLREGDVLHADEISNAGASLDAMVGQGDVVALPAAHGIVGLAGAMLDRAAELEVEVEQLQGRLDRAEAGS